MGWSFPPGIPHRLTAATPEASEGGVFGSDAVLARINVNTASASASLAVYSGPFGASPTPSTTGTQIAKIDCATLVPTRELMIRCPGGWYAVLTPAATGADVTIVGI